MLNLAGNLARVFTTLVLTKVRHLTHLQLSCILCWFANALPHNQLSDVAVKHAGHSTLTSILQLVRATDAYTMDEKTAKSADISAKWNIQTAVFMHSSLR